MKLVARGWGRDHGENVIGEKDLTSAKVGRFESYFRWETYVTSAPEFTHGSRYRVIEDGKVEIRFGAKIALNGDYLVQLTLTKDEIGKLFRLQYADSTIEELCHLFEVDTRGTRDSVEQLALDKAIAFKPELLKKVVTLGYSARTNNCLRNSDIMFVGDLVQKTEAEMLREPNFGRKSLNEIKERLAKIGLHLGMELPGWPPNNIDELSARFEGTETEVLAADN